MIATEFNAATVYLLNDEPDWSTPPRLRATLPTERHRGLTGREVRRPLGETLRWELDWTATLDRSQANALRDALQELGDETIVCPLWPMALPGDNWLADSRWTGSAYLIGWQSDWSDFAISDALTPGDWDYVAPALFGKLAAIPQVETLGTLHATAALRFREDSDAEFAVVPDAVAFANGVALADGTVPKIFPLDVDWNARPASGAAEVLIERHAIGAGRSRAATYYPQSAERPISADLLLNGSGAIGQLLRWWLDRRAGSQAHYITAPAIVARLAANATAGTNEITLTDAADLGENRFVELSDGNSGEIVRITAIAGNVCTLSANLAANWNATTTLVRLALLARHIDDEIELQFASPVLAHSQTSWRELPAEYTVAAGETRGTSVGTQPLVAFLYELTLDWNGTTEVHRCTGYELTLDASYQTWTARSIEHGELRQTLALDRDETNLKLRWWADCPFRVFLPNALGCKVGLKIYQCDVVGQEGTNVVQIFGGEILGATMDGPIISARAAGANALFDRKFPRMLVQPRCNHALFDAGCGLDRADWTATANVYAVGGATVTLDTFVFPGGDPAGFGFAHWFALGYIERTVGGLPQRLLIFDSAVLGSGRIVITLGAAPSPAFTLGEDVTITPGCDNRLETCSAWADPGNLVGKFNNAAKFLGFPFAPDKSPSFQPLKKSTSTTGKK